MSKTLLLLATAMVASHKGNHKYAARAVLAASKQPDSAAIIQSIATASTEQARKVQASRKRVKASEDFLFTQHDLLGEEGPSQFQHQHEDTRTVQEGDFGGDMLDEFADFDEDETYDASASRAVASLMKASKAMAKKKVKAEDEEEGDDEAEKEDASCDDEDGEEKAKSKAKAKKKVKAEDEEDGDDEAEKEEAAFRGRLQRAARMLNRR